MEPSRKVGGSGHEIRSGRYRPAADSNSDIAEEKGWGTPHGNSGIYNKIYHTSPAAQLMLRGIVLPTQALPLRFAGGKARHLDFLERAYRGVEGGIHRYLASAYRGMLTYGFDGHEATERIDSKGFLVPDRFLQRAPWSVWKIHTKEERFDGITQQVQLEDDKGRETVRIEAERLLWHVHDFEGGHYSGTSLFRAAYAPWQAIQDIWRYAKMRMWRSAVPLLTMHMDAEAWEDEVYKDDAAEFMSQEGPDIENFLLARSAEGGKSPFEMHLGSSPSNDLIDLARYFEWQIYSIGLQQYQALGTGSVGARAVGDVQSRVYWRSLKAFTEMLLRAINDTSAFAPWGSIRRLVEMNFGPQEVYPQAYLPVPRADSFEGFATAMKTLADGPAPWLHPTARDERQLREEWGLAPLGDLEREIWPRGFAPAPQPEPAVSEPPEPEALPEAA